MKALEFITRVLAESKFDTSALGGLSVDTELPDEAVKSYEQNLLSRERALVDPELNKTIQAKAYKALNDGFDRDFIAYAEANLPKEVAEKVKAEKYTRKRWEVLTEAIKNPESSDDKVKGARKEIEALHNQLKEKDALLVTTKEESEGRIIDFKRDYLISEKLAGLDIVDNMKAYPKLLRNQLFDNISKKGIIFTVENDQLVPRKKTETGELVDVYEANTKVGLDDLIKRELADFIKKSAGTGGNNGNRGGSTPPVVPKSGMTLDEINRLRVAENFAKLKSQS